MHLKKPTQARQRLASIAKDGMSERKGREPILYVTEKSVCPTDLRKGSIECINALFTHIRQSLHFFPYLVYFFI